MTLCASCGLQLYTDEALCAHHHTGWSDDDWAMVNRVMCEFFHRGKEPPRVEPKDRDVDFWDPPVADGLPPPPPNLPSPPPQDG